ncbi:MAG: HAMP domain-containing protein [Spirochaetes bacterium]|nr:MAG: HAMP domain-containing protein [Spirochaetota bacterium]
METQEFLYLNYFSIGAFIATAFNIAGVVFLVLIPRKSRPTIHLLLVYLFIMLQNMGYLFASSVYHPAAAYHRWITVFAVIPGIIYMTRFFFYFPHPERTRLAGIACAAQWTISIAVDAVFFWKTTDLPRIYHFDGQYWDFDADRLSYLIGIVIMANIAMVLAAGIWRIMTSTGKNRLYVVLILASMMVILVAPAIANVLSREGTIDREYFQVTWNLVTVLGFFLMLTVYVNVTPDRSSIMAKIAGISMVTFLLFFQGFVYIVWRYGEQLIDGVKMEQLRRAVGERGYFPAEMRYLYRYDPGTGEGTVLKSGAPHPWDPARIQSHLVLADLHDRLGRLDGEGARAALHSFAKIAPPYLQAYAALLSAHAGTIETTTPARHLEKLCARIAYHGKKLAMIPEAGFRERADAYLETMQGPEKIFANVVRRRLHSLPQDAGSLRAEAIAYFVPLPDVHTRMYRSGPDDNHYLSYVYIDRFAGMVYEGGFSYAEYRAQIHVPAVRLIALLGGIILLMVTVFPFFFLRAIVRPLRLLLDGVKKVNEGRLEAQVPVLVEDEIGYLSRSFNNMVASVSEAQRDAMRMRYYFQNVIDSMPSILLSVDTDGRITRWNREAERFSGFAGALSAGRMFGEAFPFLEAQAARVRNAIWLKTAQSPERIRTEEEGTPRYFDVMIFPLMADDIEGAVIRLDDITARVKLEEMIVQSEKMLSLGGLAAGMAHEINNPLGGILMGAENVIRRFSPALPANTDAAAGLGLDLGLVNAYLEKRDILTLLAGIREMGARASRIVANMLAFSREGEPVMTSVGVEQLARKAIEIAAHDFDINRKYDFKHIGIIWEVEPALPPLQCVATEIEQVLLNLLKNAAHAMGEKAYGEDAPQIKIRLGREGGFHRIEIEDNGPGMTENVRKRIFEPFYTTKKTGHGTGLGLSVSYFIITNNHKGIMTVESLPGRGAKFVIVLPSGVGGPGGS